jgi:hypothetical protein
MIYQDSSGGFKYRIIIKSGLDDLFLIGVDTYKAHIFLITEQHGTKSNMLLRLYLFDGLKSCLLF